MGKQKGGHPAKQDPAVAKLFRAMRSTTELVRDLDGRLTEEQLMYLKSCSIGLMFTYAELTGLPNPAEVAFGPAK